MNATSLLRDDKRPESARTIIPDIFIRPGFAVPIRYWARDDSENDESGDERLPDARPACTLPAIANVWP